MAKVLVVDDEAHIRELLRFVLEEDGHQVEGAANGVVALNLNKEVRADVIITDILMPGMDGLDLIHELRQEFPEARVIAVSGALNADQEEDLFQASRMGGGPGVFEAVRSAGDCGDRGDTGGRTGRRAGRRKAGRQKVLQFAGIGYVVNPWVHTTTK